MFNQYLTINIPNTIILSACLFFAGSNASANPIISDTDTFPVRGAPYVSENGTTYTTIDTEMVSLSLVSTNPGSLLPPLGSGTFVIDSFFDVFTEISIGGGGFQVDSFFDVFTQIAITNRGTDSNGNRVFDTEILSMDLSSSPTDGQAWLLREDPNRVSPGQHSVTTLPAGDFQIDSFFDVFTEISIDGGNSWASSSTPLRVSLIGVPLPGTLLLLASGLLGLITIARRE